MRGRQGRVRVALDGHRQHRAVIEGDIAPDGGLGRQVATGTLLDHGPRDPARARRARRAARPLRYEEGARVVGNEWGFRTCRGGGIGVLGQRVAIAIGRNGRHGHSRNIGAARCHIDLRAVLAEALLELLGALRRDDRGRSGRLDGVFGLGQARDFGVLVRAFARAGFSGAGKRIGFATDSRVVGARNLLGRRRGCDDGRGVGLFHSIRARTFRIVGIQASNIGGGWVDHGLRSALGVARIEVRDIRAVVRRIGQEAERGAEPFHTGRVGQFVTQEPTAEQNGENQGCRR